MIAFTLSVFFLLGVMGLSFDVGRMYCARSEAQAFVDSAALDAALHMDGTKAGLQAAVTAATSDPDVRKLWRFNTASFVPGDVNVHFSTLASSGFRDLAAVPDPPTGYHYVRVTTGVTVPLTLLRAVVRDTASSTVAAGAVATQVKKTKFTDGIFPFSPMTPNPAAIKGNEDSWGYVKGQLYTLQWASTPKLDQPATVCPGDATPEMLARFGVDKNQRGFIVGGASAAEIKAVIRNGTEDYPIAEGDSLMTGGTKESETNYVNERSRTDIDPSNDYSSYLDGTSLKPVTGNGARIVIVPVNTGPPNREIVGFARFLLPPNIPMGGNKPMCAWYVGSGVIGGSGKAIETGGMYRIALVK